MKSKTKSKKNKIPLCPKRNNVLKKKIVLNKASSVTMKHWKTPSTPSLLTPKNINLSFNNNFNSINTSKRKIDNKGATHKQCLFHAFIPKSKSNSEAKLKKQNIVLIKKLDKGNQMPFNFSNIKEYIYKRENKDTNNNNILKNNNINAYEENKNIQNKEKDTLSSNNSHYMNNINTNANSNTTIGMSQVLSDRFTKEENNNKIFGESKNPLEFTFGDINFLQSQIHYETKTSLNRNNSFKIKSGTKQINDSNNSKNTEKNNSNLNIKKNILIKNIIKNIKQIHPKILLNNKNIKEKNKDITFIKYNHVKSHSIDKDSNLKDKNKISHKLMTFTKWPKIFNHQKVNNIEKNKNNMKINYNDLSKSPNIPKKLINLIPVDKKHNLNKKNKGNVKNHLDKINDNNRVAISTKNKDNKKNIHKLFINQSSSKIIPKTNKSTPKLFLKHPSLKNLFEL